MLSSARALAHSEDRGASTVRVAGPPDNEIRTLATKRWHIDCVGMRQDG